MQSHHYLEIGLRGEIERNDTEEVLRLIARIKSSNDSRERSKARINALNDDQQTFLHYALECRSYDAFRVLLPYFKDMSKELLQSRDINGMTIFNWAIARFESDIAKELFELCYESQTPALAKQIWLVGDVKGLTPLHFAAGSANQDLLPWLLSKLDDSDNLASMVNLFDENADTPLHHACQRNQNHHIVALLKAGADVELKNDKGESYLTYLEKDASLFPTDCDRQIQRSLLEKLRRRLQAKSDNEPLKQLLIQVSPLVSLLDTARLAIIVGKVKHILPNNIEIIVNPEAEPITENHHNKLTQEKQIIVDHINHIESIKDKINEMKKLRKISIKDIIRGTIIGLSVLSMIIIMLVVPLFTPIILPLLVVVLVAFTIFCASNIWLFVDIYKDYQKNKMVEKDADILITKCENVLDKLIALENTDATSLPVDTATIRLLQAHIQTHKNYDGIPNETSKLNGVLLNLDEIKNTLMEISKGITKHNKLIMLIKGKPEPGEEVSIIIEDNDDDSSEMVNTLRYNGTLFGQSEPHDNEATPLLPLSSGQHNTMANMDS